MKRTFYVALALMTVLGLSSCATNSGTGALGGAAAGGLIGQAIGHNTGATLLGAGVGAVGGAMIGNEADKANQANAQAQMAQQQGGQPPPQVVYGNGPQGGPGVVMQPQVVQVLPNRSCHYSRHREVVYDQYGYPHRERILLCPNQYGEFVPVRR